ncbi:MAG: hypothetical protein AN487_05280, partial [Anabaena sp. CRKS33]
MKARLLCGSFSLMLLSRLALKIVVMTREEGRGKREQVTGNREEGRGKREQVTGNREEGRGKR